MVVKPLKVRAITPALRKYFTGDFAVISIAKEKLDTFGTDLVIRWKFVSL
jgi:hypothetical protein